MPRCALALSLAAASMLWACGSTRDPGPAWPRSAGRIEVDPEKDGGESLEPTHASSVAAIERAEDRTPRGDEAAIIEVVDAPPEEIEIDKEPVEAPGAEAAAEPDKEPAAEDEGDDED